MSGESLAGQLGKGECQELHSICFEMLVLFPPPLPSQRFLLQNREGTIKISPPNT